MHYIFTMLVVLNACLFGYYAVFANNSTDASVMKEKNSLTKEVTFKNSSKDISPVIGTAN